MNMYQYPYGYQQPYFQNFQQTDERIRNLENRLENYPKQSSVNYNPNYNNPNPVPQTQAPNIIIVKSADEAWNYSPDYTGALQYFYDGENFYTKTFDANIPATIKTVFKKITEPQESVDEPTPDIHAQELDTLEKRIIDLEIAIKELTDVLKERFVKSDGLLKEILENVSNDFECSVGVDKPSLPGCGCNSEQSNGSGEEASLPRASNGRFTKRS